LRFFDKIEILDNFSMYIRKSQSAGYDPRDDANELVIDNERAATVTLEKSVTKNF